MTRPLVLCALLFVVALAAVGALFVTSPYKAAGLVRMCIGERADLGIDDFPWLHDFIASRDRLCYEYVRSQRTLVDVADVSEEEAQVNADRGWKMLPIQVLKRPKRNDCPHTTALVRKHGKHLASVFFSVLEPGTTLAPHAGPNSGVVRCHIPIIIPKDTSRLGLRHETNAGVRVERWDAPFIFDDTRVHSAWNHTSEQRVVLLLEVIRPMSTVQHALFSLALHLASLSSVADRI